MKNQSDLPGVSGDGISSARIQVVDDAADAYVVQRDKRMLLTPKEVETKKKLIDLMHEHADTIGRDDKGVMKYRHGKLTITLAPTKEKLTVKTDSDEEIEAE